MSGVQNKQVIFLMGPTSAGKTDIAVDLVKSLDCEIISVDSAMIYRGMDIGTAKPGKDVLNVAPHSLIDIRDPSESYSAASFRHDALKEIDRIFSDGKIPLLVGGTMLYFRALSEGLSNLPSADQVVRERLEQEAAEVGWGAMHGKLMEVDPETAARIHPNDPQRIQRALEIYEIEGQAMSTLIHQGKEALPFSVKKITIAPQDRSVLHQRIDSRFYVMMELGLLNEVEKLFKRSDLHENLPAIRAVGYRQLWAYLQGKMNLEDAVQKAIIATRQLAKRQLTWLRADPESVWFDGADRNILDKVLKTII